MSILSEQSTNYQHPQPSSPRSNPTQPNEPPSNTSLHQPPPSSTDYTTRNPLTAPSRTHMPSDPVPSHAQALGQTKGKAKEPGSKWADHVDYAYEYVPVSQVGAPSMFGGKTVLSCSVVKDGSMCKSNFIPSRSPVLSTLFIRIMARFMCWARATIKAVVDNSWMARMD